MRLYEIEPNTHTPQDWHKRLSNSLIYGKVVSNEYNHGPCVLSIRAISELDGCSEAHFAAALCTYRLQGVTQQFTVSLPNLNVLAFKPEPGVYNVGKFPVLCTHLPFRQWHFGCTPESLSIKRLDGRNWDLAMKDYEKLFNPEYPTLGDAIELLKKKDRKHIAVSPRVSILASGAKADRFAVLYKFVPLATINNGMWFPTSAAKPLEKVATEYKDVLLELTKP